ncbi:hypothetical protein LMG23992_00110 [Cupriavidus laharis]|uniref:Uncharacterized protein n=2 Tax=Cupriavidus laharis TaxID=151654 RepID=A0ABM8WCE0_9BURK|nr:hypothetical protein LMG23992_00110 [Cupriavidus laharis]
MAAWHSCQAKGPQPAVQRAFAAAPPARLQRLFALVSMAAAALLPWRAFTGAA